MKVIHLLTFALLQFTLPAFTQETSSLDRLMQGNQRFVKEALLHPNRSHESRVLVSEGQMPFAIILGCADSRVSPEIVFDQGIGDLFVVRVAGNVAGPLEIESIGYGIAHLGAKLIVVLGHQHCGALKAILNDQEKEIPELARILDKAKEIAVKLPGDLLENTIKENVRLTVKTLQENATLSSLIQERNVQVVGGYYNLSSGVVELLTSPSKTEVTEKPALVEKQQNQPVLPVSR